MRIFVYPGSFDPVTRGHMDIINRAAALCDRLIVAVLTNSGKHPTFSKDERMDLLRTAIGDRPGIEVHSFEGLLVHFMDHIGATTIVKGLRAMSDFEYEMQMALINKHMNPAVETLFMMADTQYSFLSASVVRELAQHGGPVGDFVPEGIADTIRNKYARKG
jgi:pantetheine-phosphate adenylyltransferase